MPWHIENNDGKYCVHKDDDGENVGCHDTREEAESHMQALYAHEDEMGKSASVQPLFKSFAVKAPDAELKDNHFRGIASFMGNIDDGHDVIAPGAFKDAIPGFLKAGFVPIGHDWYEKPVAMPTAAYEDGNKLIAEAEFHSTPSAQEAKTIVKERLEKGLDVGLSIGFDIADGGASIYESGAKMLDALAETKSDTSLFDLAALKSHKKPVRLITKIARLFEFSIVSVPMNPLAVATSAKILATEDFDALDTERDFERFLREAGFSKNAALKFVSAFKGIVLRRDAGSDNAPDPDASGETPPNKPVVITPTEQVTPPSERPFLFTADGKVYPQLWTL